jgi:hypothetical protein
VAQFYALGGIICFFMTLEEAVRKNPKRKLSIRQKVFCGLFGFLIALLYVTLTWMMVWFRLRHGLGAFDPPDAKSELWDISFYVVLLPFGSVPFLDHFAVLLDMIFWGIIGGAIYALFCPRKIVA